MSAGNAASTAASISRARLDMNSPDARGSGMPTGPDDERDLGARRGGASAMAWPCLPEERLAM